MPDARRHRMPRGPVAPHAGRIPSDSSSSRAPQGRIARPSQLIAILFMIGILLIPGLANAQIGSHRYSSIVIDAGSGAILSSINPDERRYPASLAKVMTIYMVFEAVRDRRVSLQQLVPISPHAASMAPTKLGLLPGTRITVEEAVLGLITRSANDAAAALAELLGGTEERFAQMMTLRARALGMTNTRFENASGLPDLYQVSTARDMATLARRMISDFPGQYRYFSTQQFVWHGRSIHNHHQLLHSYPGADGLKTGYTHASGYNLITSAVRGGTRLIGVVMGGASGGERDAHMVHLLNAGFEKLNIPPERRQPNANGTVMAQTSATRPLISGAQATAAAARPTKQAQLAQGSAPTPRVQTTSASTPASRRDAWSIQVGSFTEEKHAREAAASARRITDTGRIRVESATSNQKRVWRAQITSLSGSDAQSACQTLSKRRTPCMIVRPENL